MLIFAGLSITAFFSVYSTLILFFDKSDDPHLFILYTRFFLVAMLFTSVRWGAILVLMVTYFYELTIKYKSGLRILETIIKQKAQQRAIWITSILLIIIAYALKIKQVKGF